MGVDWFTLIAQLLNFLVLVWLLRRFLFGRIVRAMAEREAGIAARLGEAERIEAEARNELEKYRSRNRELEQQRSRLLAEAREQAEAKRLELLDEARTEVDGLREQWLAELRGEKHEFLQEFRRRAGQQVFAVIGRTLKDLADARLEKQVVTAFLRHLRRVDRDDHEQIAAAARDEDGVVEVRSAFGLDPGQRDEVTETVRELLGEAVVVRFEVEPTLLCGIELRAHSQRLVWNFESYLQSLEEAFFHDLEEREVTDGRYGQEADNGRPAASADGHSR